jgi:enoyl-[acyl-carrier protein] reductase III
MDQAGGRRFQGKTALVTGSGRGIGRAIALKLASEGADVVINFLRKRSAAEETAQAVARYGAKTHLVKADVGDADDLTRLFGEIQDVFGGLDILVHNAASGYIRPAMEQTVKGWEWTMNINARSLLFLAQQAVPLMEGRRGGKIVSISSLGSTRVMENYIVVGVSKAALEALTRYLAVELAPKNIAVNAVSGGVVDTDALKFFPQREQMIRMSQERTPAGRMVEPEDLANVVAFLCSDDAAMIRGQTIVVDGGFSLLA